jgi:hypothetical protein
MDLKLRNFQEAANSHPSKTGCATNARTNAIFVRALRVFGGASVGSILRRTTVAYQITGNEMTAKTPHRTIHATWRELAHKNKA